jgi:hypothetical protein
MNKYTYLLKELAALVVPVVGYYIYRKQHADMCVEKFDIELKEVMCSYQSFAGAERLLLVYIIFLSTYALIRLFLEVGQKKDAQEIRNISSSVVFILIVLALICVFLFTEQAALFLFPEEELFGKWIFSG